MSPENAHKQIRIYMGGLILGVNTFYMHSCFLKQFALVGKGLRTPHPLNGEANTMVFKKAMEIGTGGLTLQTQSSIFNHRVVYPAVGCRKAEEL